MKQATNNETGRQLCRRCKHSKYIKHKLKGGTFLFCTKINSGRAYDDEPFTTKCFSHEL